MTILSSQSIRRVSAFNELRRLEGLDNFQFYEVQQDWVKQEILSLSSSIQVETVQAFEEACNQPALTHIVVAKNCFGPAMAARIAGRTGTNAVVILEGEYNE